MTSEWISVKERLPKEGQRVILLLSNGLWGKGYLRSLRPDSRARSMWRMDGHCCDVPAYWMPLPDPPKEAQS